MQAPRKPSRSFDEDDARLLVLQEMLCGRVEDLLDTLGISLSQGGGMWTGCCPVHVGDNPTALNLYPEGHTAPGYWVCRTHHCERVFKRTIVGFVRGVLSNQRFGWAQRGDREVSFADAKRWCADFLGIVYDNLTADVGRLQRQRFTGEVATLVRKASGQQGTLSRECIRSFLRPPASYFIQRGWSREVLDRYDVGLYPRPGRPLSDRVVVPVYDERGEASLGFTGRSIFERCPRCSRWHGADAPCPETKEARALASKWRNHELDRDGVLYNWWGARAPIRETGVACIVEGPGDLWRLVEAGVEVGVALLGADLTERQQVLLEMSGAMTLVVLTNADGPGRAAAVETQRRLRRLFRVVIPDLPAQVKDLGDMAVADVRDLVSPIVEKYRRSF